MTFTSQLGLDTIVALATAAGRAAIALVRLSGPKSLTLIQPLFIKDKKLIPRHATLTKLAYDRHLMDEAVVTFYPKPHSYTGEDVVEIACHGNPLIVQKIIYACLELGARLARPGEFTQRAFLNGRMDLTQAEAVMDVISAQTELALHSALTTNQGGLRQKVESLRKNLIKSIAHLEAYIDFPDEDIQPAAIDEIQTELNQEIKEIETLLATSEAGRILREGIRTVIIGQPNVGKSSLLNILTGVDRAIVTPIAGTTRDTIDEWLDINGVPFRIIDTAGIRHSEEIVEQEGIRRSKNAIASAEFILHLVEATQPFSIEDQTLRKSYDTKRSLLIANKNDLVTTTVSPLENVADIFISTKTGQGIELLKQRMLNLVWQGKESNESEVTINARHRDCLLRAKPALLRALDGITHRLSPEFISVELRETLNALTEIIGVTSNEDILDHLFRSFCIGK